MSSAAKNRRNALGVLLAVAIFAAQTAALAHALQHDPASAQSQACATCVAANSLSSACVTTIAEFDLQPCHTGISVQLAPVPGTIHPPLARQRAPPKTL